MVLQAFLQQDIQKSNHKKILKILNTVKDLGGYACCHEIDRKLFMIGR